MSFPFASKGVEGRPKSHRYMRLIDAINARLERSRNRSRLRRELARRIRLTFDPLEPRLLLNSDLNINLGHDGPTIDHQVLIRLIDEIQQTDDQTVTVQRVQILDQNGGAVLGIADLSSISSIAITGGSGNDKFTIDAASFGDHALPQISIDGAGGADTVVFDSTDAASWTVDAANAGNVTAGNGFVSFASTENLTGAAGNNDTFTIAHGATISGSIDGGTGGYDVLLFTGRYQAASYAATGAGSGIVGADGARVSFAGLEMADPDSDTMDRRSERPAEHAGPAQL